MVDNYLEWNRDMCFLLDVKYILIVYKIFMCMCYFFFYFYGSIICLLGMNINDIIDL